MILFLTTEFEALNSVVASNLSFTPTGFGDSQSLEFTCLNMSLYQTSTSCNIMLNPTLMYMKDMISKFNWPGNLEGTYVEAHVVSFVKYILDTLKPGLIITVVAMTDFDKSIIDKKSRQIINCVLSTIKTRKHTATLINTMEDVSDAIKVVHRALVGCRKEKTSSYNFWWRCFNQQTTTVSEYDEDDLKNYLLDSGFTFLRI